MSALLGYHEYWHINMGVISFPLETNPAVSLLASQPSEEPANLFLALQNMPPYYSMFTLS